MWRKTQGQEEQAILESEKEAVIWMLEETDEYRKIVEDVSGGSDVDVERKMRHWASKLQERPRGDILECGLGRLKQGEKDTNSKSNGGRHSKGRNKTSKASKCVSAKNDSWGRQERKTQANLR